MKDTEFYVDVADGVRYYLVERREDAAESKKAVLLLHGGASGYVTWDVRIKDYSVMDYLAERDFVVYGVDMRGFGKSTKTSGLDVRAETCADDVKNVVDFIKRRLGVDKIYLAGGSFGSIVGATYAGKYQTDLEKLALMSPPYKEMSDAFKVLLLTILDLIDKGEGYFPNAPEPQKLAAELYSPDQKVLSFYADLCISHCPENPTGSMLDLVQGEDGELPHDHYIPLIMVPTVVITGANDELCLIDNAQQLYQDLGVRNKQIVVIPNAMHRVFLEREAHLAYMQGLCDWFKD